MMEITAVRKSIHVDRPVDVAFKVFTEEMSSWWPHETHSFLGEGVKDSILEGRVGGRLYERGTGGEEFDIGTVTVWEPPSHVAFTWTHREPEAHTEVEVRFTPDGEGTRVELEHRGWERLGEDGASQRDEYDPGWDYVLSKYVQGLQTA